MGTPIVPKMTYNLIENGQLNRSAAAEALRKFLEETIRVGKFDLKASVRALDPRCGSGRRRRRNFRRP
jgi:hypothetical protein